MPLDFRIVTKGARELERSFNDINRHTERATMYAVREAGRRTKQVAKREAPVLGDKSAATRRQHAAGEAGNRPVRGLLRASIHSSRRLTRTGAGGFAVRVAPRGDRVHLYSQRIEALYGYMRKAHETVAPELAEIARKAWERSTRGRR